ncbi:hypothetical protein FSP39_015313 [Pinctada imbricata]|uniref:XRN2-binding (XTBD) domain-containing protein n=1 Tax=Pinctada imbricata TaxID=66713 RepID=A0AA88YSE3_PINIB|nr:hypothetical protein FSP39_015313 [Pinctada imbricata]
MDEEKIMETVKAVEKFRNPYESDHEWKLRRDFLIANYGSFSDDRLVCMSNCYINSEEYGCRYPLMVMGQINEMMEGLQRLPEEVTKIKGVQLVKFVKSEEKSENGESKNSEIGKERVSAEVASKDIEGKRKEEAAKIVEEAKITMDKKIKAKREAMCFVPASGEYKSMEENLQTPTNQTFKTKFMEECQPKPVSHTSVAVVNCHSHLHTRLDSKLEASEAQDQESENTCSLPVNEELTNMIRTFAKFFKLYRTNHSDSSSINVFHMSSTKSRLKLDVHFQNLSTKTEPKFHASVKLEGVVLAEADDGNKKGAKKAAFDLAQNKLTKNFLQIVKVNPEKMELHSYDSKDESERNNRELVAQVDLLNDQEDSSSSTKSTS